MKHQHMNRGSHSNSVNPSRPRLPAVVTKALSIALLGFSFGQPVFAQTVVVDANCDFAVVNGRAGFVDFDDNDSLAVFSDDAEEVRLASINPAQYPQCQALLGEVGGPTTPTPTPAPTPTPTPTPTPSGDPREVPATASAEEKQAAMLAVVNAVRSTPTVCNGVTLPAVPPLTRAQALDASAQAHSDDMAANNYFDHSGQDGSSFGSRATAAGYTNFPTGENIAAGSATVGGAVDNWLGSTSGHCEGLMTDGSNEMGSGGGYNPNAQWTNYWTFVTGRRG